MVCPTIKTVFLFQGKRISLCFLVAALLQIEKEPQPPSELLTTQSIGRLPAYWKGQDLQHHRGVGSLERMERGRGVKCPLCSIRQAQAKLKSRLQKKGALRNAEVVVLNPVGCWRGAGWQNPAGKAFPAHWVSEQELGSVPGNQAERCLIFLSSNEIWLKSSEEFDF